MKQRWRCDSRRASPTASPTRTGPTARLVYTVAYRVLGDAGSAEDARQQTFVQAWQNAASFDPKRSLAPWLTTIAGRAAIDIYRRNRRHRDHRNLDDLGRLDDALSVTPPSAEQIYDVWQVRRAVAALPARTANSSACSTSGSSRTSRSRTVSPCHSVP